MEIGTYSDEHIIRLCQEGRNNGFTALLHVYQQRVYRRAFSFLRVHDDALDATQDVFIKVVQAIDHFRPGNPLWPWLRQITTNTCLNHIRSRQNRPTTVSLDDAHEMADNDVSPERAAEIAWDQEQLQTALSVLPPVQRMVIVLRHNEHMTYEEIARTMSMPLGTVKTQLFRGRQALRNMLRNEVSL